ncbi:MAG: MlaD family protein [Crocinitomicaceae bacterium]|nr:MlaD family protein [Crocinitomicaceae bacterium]
MKISKELKTGIAAVIAIALLIAGINFLKGNSFFGGDDTYYVYLSESGGVAPATSVYVNGVIVGKVLEVKLTNKKEPNQKVMMRISIQDRDFKIPVGSSIHPGSIDLLSKGLIIEPSEEIASYHKPGDYIQGGAGSSLISDVKEYADPLVQKVQDVATSVDKFIVSFQSFWDTTAASELKTTFKDVQFALQKFGSIANDLQGLVASEKAKLSNILSNVESITGNLHKSNDKIEGILGNLKTFSDDLVTADFKGVISEAKTTLTKFNSVLESATQGEGTLGKLIKDDQLYNELNITNKRLQSLVEDIEVHPERYIHFSVFGAKTKGVPLTPSEERQLKQLLDSTKTK